MTKKKPAKPKKKRNAELEAERPDWLDLDLSRLEAEREFIDAKIKYISRHGCLELEEDDE